MRAIKTKSKNSMRAALAGFLLIAGFALPLSAWAVDTDGDGVDDSVDAFPNNAEATVDTDGDGQPNSIDYSKLPGYFYDPFNGTTFTAGWRETYQNIYERWKVSGGTAYYSGGFNGSWLLRDFNVPASGGTFIFRYRVNVWGGCDFINQGNVISLPNSGVWQTMSINLSGGGTYSPIWKAKTYHTNGSVELDYVELRPNSLLVEDTDDDNDGVLDVTDRFPLDATESVDSDNDGVGNNADVDDDNDGGLDVSDNCPINSNADQLNTDGDAQGNVCDADDDNDGVADTLDKFPLDALESVDADNDGIGNNADADDDNDSVQDIVDNCPLNTNVDQLDTDDDELGNVCDTDDDNDGVADTSDKFPLNAAASSDTDNDGFAGSWNAACDAVCQSNSGLVLDNCPSNANANQLNTDGDTQGNVCDADDDNDGVLDIADRFPLDATESVDNDNDGVGNNADADDDNDGAPDYLDPEPLNPANSSVWPLNNNYQGSAVRESQVVQ